LQRNLLVPSFFPTETPFQAFAERPFFLRGKLAAILKLIPPLLAFLRGELPKFFKAPFESLALFRRKTAPVLPFFEQVFFLFRREIAPALIVPLDSRLLIGAKKAPSIQRFLGPN